MRFLILYAPSPYKRKRRRTLRQSVMEMSLDAQPQRCQKKAVAGRPLVWRPKMADFSVFSLIFFQASTKFELNWIYTRTSNTRSQKVLRLLIAPEILRFIYRTYFLVTFTAIKQPGLILIDKIPLPLLEVLHHLLEVVVILRQNHRLQTGSISGSTQYWLDKRFR